MSKAKGLSQKSAEVLLQQYGPNKLPEKGPPSSFVIFLSQFKSPLVYVLLFGTLIALVLRELTDALAIFLALFINAFLGFYQERKASRALTSLKAILHPQAVVIRDGKQKKILMEEVVPGDLVVLNAGDRVPADGALVEAVDLSVNEAILTGESMPVRKLAKLDQLGQLVFMGTTVVSGRGLFEVTKTGRQTQMGQIAKSLGEKETPTPLQKQLARLAKQLTVLIVVVCLGLMVGGFWRGWEPSQTILTSLAVAVAAIPEGLLVALTVILALGMQTMARKKGLVRKLVAAETLGGVTTICVDKTGTLTEGEMRATKAVLSLNERLPARNASQSDAGGKIKNGKLDLFLKSAVLCNNLSDPLEVAMMEWAQKRLNLAGVKSQKLKVSFPRIDEIPFDPEKKFMATLHDVSGKSGDKDRIMFVHGAPETVISKCQMFRRKGGRAPVKYQMWMEKIKEFGEEGCRMVGFAYKKLKVNPPAGGEKLKVEDVSGLEWQGILLFEDPIRPGVAEALKLCQEAGIKVKVITGDYAPTALAVLQRLKLGAARYPSLDRAYPFAVLKVADSPREDGFAASTVTGSELDQMSDEELQKRISDIILFARTTPQQKLKIVKALKANGEVVAMTGDGVNDAPALQAADIGIVVAEASDVAKETADLVLLDSNFATIVKAVSVGRSIFENIKKVVLYLLSDSFTEVILIGGSQLLGLPLPLLPAQILWVNLVEDGLPAMALAFEGEEKDLMEREPRNPKRGILDTELKILIFIIGIMTDLFLFGLFVFLVGRNYEPELLQTIIFLGLAINSLFYVFACRNLGKNLWQFNPFGNRFLNFSVFLGFVFLILAVYFAPLRILLRTRAIPLEFWFLVLGIGVFNLAAIEVGKWAFLKLKIKN